MDESLLNESFADAGSFAGFGFTFAGSLSVFRSPLAESLAGAGVAAAGSMLACGSLAAESFAGAGSFELPLGGSPSGELTGAGILGAGVGVGVGFAAWDAGAATAAAAGAPEFGIGAGGAGPKAFPGTRARGGSYIAIC